MDAFHYGPPEPRVYICPDCGQEHTDYGQKPDCWPRSETEKLMERIAALEARVTELETLEKARRYSARVREQIELEQKALEEKWKQPGRWW